MLLLSLSQRATKTTLTAAIILASLMEYSLANQENIIDMKISDAVQMGIERNLTLIIDRLKKTDKELARVASLKPFSPYISFNSAYKNSNLRSNIPKGETKPEHRIRTEAGVAINKTTTFGTNLSVGATADKDHNGFSDPNHASTLSLEIKQPLLKFDTKNSDSAKLELAKMAYEVQKALFRSKVNEVILAIQKAYWQLKLKQIDVEMKKRSLERAKAKFSDTRQDIKKGILAESEIYIVEENLVYYQKELTKAKENLSLASNRLALLLNLGPNVKIKAVDELKNLNIASELDQLDVALKKAMKNNPYILKEKLSLEYAKKEKQGKLNETRPDLDLSARYTIKGEDGKFASTWDRMEKRERDGLQVGLFFSMPLTDQADNSAIKRTTIAVKQHEYQLQNERAKLNIQVTNLFTTLRSQLHIVNLAIKQFKLTRLRLDTEEEKYQNGISVLSDIVELQRDLDKITISITEEKVKLINTYNELLSSRGDLLFSVGIKSL